MSKHFTRLDNGMRIVTEHLGNLESVSLGFWLTQGSRHETASENGMFHFIEHTLFKGTPHRNARQIAEAFDGIGGNLDAYTGKEETCFSFRLRAKHLNLGLTILSDMLQHPSFAEAELAKEQQVIMEEIKMAADDPDDLAFETAMQACWAGHSLGRPILGSAEHVQSFDSARVKAFHQAHYRPENLIVAAAGRLDHEELCQRIQTQFGDFGRPELRLPEIVPPPTLKPFRKVIDRPHLEQTTFCLMFPGVAQSDRTKPALALLSTLLGGGMSSRLFQTIREDHGLAYSIGSFFGTYADAGFLAIYGNCAPENLQRVLGLIAIEIRRLKASPVKKDELERIREQCVGGLVLGLESSYSRAGALAKAMHYRGNIFDLQREIATFSGVDSAALLELANQLLTTGQLGVSLVGPVAGLDLDLNINLDG